MLVLTRKQEELIRIGDDVVIKVIKTGHGTVKIGIEAPRHIRVLRGELVDAEKSEKPEPVASFSTGFTGRVLSDQYPHVA